VHRSSFIPSIRFQFRGSTKHCADLYGARKTAGNRGVRRKWEDQIFT
jgi:hypothetical protein